MKYKKNNYLNISQNQPQTQNQNIISQFPYLQIQNIPPISPINNLNSNVPNVSNIQNLQNIIPANPNNISNNPDFNSFSK